ncbi:putative sporulation protein YyaC [Clostridium sporogenes]|uniref:Putative sporulation protein YyaC n=1 Tax=Clostridium sporogenes TaxID=1509 RepID=A0A1L3NKH4_CLOSG|nr:spore protease YyaC [Clostridium sporogenes]APH16666.1 putative sporulation protein YyaC [Clostridium sporogenes]
MRKIRGNYDDKNIITKISQQLLNIMDKNNGNIVIVNIGTDRCIGDSLAPFVGTILKENDLQIPVYGTIKNPIHALNLEKEIRSIKNKHPNATIIGIDACLGKKENIGTIEIGEKPVYPGKGVGKELLAVGEYSIMGTVEEFDNGIEFATGNNIRLDFILQMSKSIAKAIIKSVNYYYIENNEIAICNL